jgi:O-antigen/teichoic acid export membrane protein
MAPPDGGTLRATYAWTFASGTLYAGSTFLMLMAIGHCLGAYAGGVFSIALAAAQQLLTLGTFSARTYQVSDLHEKYSFADYLTSRVLTVGMMLCAGAVWVTFGGFSHDKAMAFLLLLLLKAAEALADVLEGRYQQKQRMDTACRGVFAKTLLALLAFFLVLWRGRSLPAALGAMFLAYLGGLVAVDGALVGLFARVSLRFRRRTQLALLAACFPMFLNAFLMMFVNNAPKYALDTFRDEKAVTHYSALFMASFVVSLFSMFLLKPMLTRFSLAYLEPGKARFLSLLRAQLRWVGGIALFCVGAAYLVGIPVLSAGFGLDLSPYRTELCLLMIGGALMAFAQVFQSVLVIIRRQAGCLFAIAATATVAFRTASPLVRSHGLAGAAWSYCASMAVLATISLSLALVFLRRDRRHRARTA